MELRDYQEEMIAKTRKALRYHRSVLLQGPTGCGKTAITVYMMGSAAKRGVASMFIVHQGELLRQTSRALWRQQLDHGVIAAGYSRSKMPVQVASIQTLIRRLDDYPAPGLIIIDEAHRAAANSYRKVLEAYPKAMVVGLTATPQRTDGQGLGDLFGDLVLGPTPRELIDHPEQYLCDYEIFAPPSPVDVSNVKKRGGDYDKGELMEAMDRTTITGDAVAHYRAHADGKRAVVMCITVAHAESVAESYRLAGIPAETIEGGMSADQREAALKRFERGETLVLTNAQLLIEGVDVPSIEVVQWLRPTGSLIVWMQGNGRGLRPAEGKERLIIFDHVGNVHRHGLIDDERDWSLDGTEKKAGKGREREEPEVTIQQCGQCFALFRPGPTACPSCGADLPRKGLPSIEVVEGNLQKLDAKQIKANRKERNSELLPLIQMGIERAYKNPSGWAAYQWAQRREAEPTKADFVAAKRIYNMLIEERK